MESTPDITVRDGWHPAIPFERIAMDLPTSTFAVAVVVALVVPGIVFAGTRAALTGYRGTDKSVGAKLTEAITISVLLDAAYLVALPTLTFSGTELTNDGERVSITDPASVGLRVLVLGAFGPVVLAALLHAVPWRRIPLPRWLQPVLHSVAVQRLPTAWDFAASSRQGNFVRIRRADGTVVGGWYGAMSYLSGYPESRDLFVEEQYAFDSDGSFLKPLDRTVGAWISVRDDDIIEWSK